MKLKSKLFYLIVLVEVLLLLFIVILVTKKYKGLSSVSISQLAKAGLVFEEGETLNFFYEPKPDPAYNPLYQPYASNEDERLTYTINNDSLHERKDYDILKNLDTFRIVTMGDSFVFGLGVADDLNWSEFLETKLNTGLSCRNIKTFEVINLGFPGYDVEYDVERFRLRGVKYDPDMALWLLKNNDLRQINDYVIPRRDYHQANMTEEEKKSYYAKGNFYPWTMKAVDDLQRDYSDEKLYAYQLNVLKKMNLYFKNKLIVFSFKDELSDKWKSLAREFTLSGDGVYFFDGVGKEIMDPSARLIDGHPNADGHKIIANALYDYLVKGNLIPCL